MSSFIICFIYLCFINVVQEEHVKMSYSSANCSLQTLITNTLVSSAVYDQ